MTHNVVTKTKLKIEDHVPEQIEKLPRRDRRALNALIDRLKKRSIFKTLADFQCPEVKSALRAGAPIVHKIRQSAAIFEMRGAVIYLTYVVARLCDVYHFHLEVLFVTPSPQNSMSQNAWRVRSSYMQDNVIIFAR